MTTPNTRIVYTPYGPKTVDSSDPYPLGRPLPGAPAARVLYAEGKYYTATEAAQRGLYYGPEERDYMEEQFKALSVKGGGNTPYGSPFSGTGSQRMVRSHGPLGRMPAPPNTPRSSWATNWFNTHLRYINYEPWFSGPPGVNDCFDVTIVAPASPVSQRFPAYKSADSYLIRDASRPNEGPRPCYALDKPGEIGVDHIDILYAPFNNRVYCRACHVNKVKYKGSCHVEIKTFPNNESWDRLRGHWLVEHRHESEEIGKLHATELQELRQQWREKLYLK